MLTVAETKRKAPAGAKEYRHLAIRLKLQMHDIIDVAYKDRTAGQRGQFKRFTIYCYDADFKSKLGDCRYMPDGSSQIRIVRLGTEGFKEVLITTMHEVSHHIDKTIRGKSGHDAPFYFAHKKLLFAAFDMGILTKYDVINSTSHARNRDKLANMMDDYVPHPVEYKKDKCSVSVYGAYSIKDMLKEYGYTWNALDGAWVREISRDEIEEEKEFLVSYDIPEKDIKIVEGSAVISRLRKNARVYNVPYEEREKMKQLGYRWNNNGKEKYWEKKIDGDELDEKEFAVLNGISGAKIKIV